MILASFFLFTSCSSSKSAQGAAGQTQDLELSKEEEKEWKDKARQYVKNPDALKALTESRELYQAEADRFEAQANELQAQINQYQNRIAQLEEENMQLTNNMMTAQQTIQQLTEENEELASRGPAEPMEEDMSGTLFRVQVGAFKKNRVPEALDTGENMDLEEDEGMQKVVVGKFRNFEEAKQLMNYLQNMGVKGAWVVSYIDGQRVPLKEALQVSPSQEP